MNRNCIHVVKHVLIVQLIYFRRLHWIQKFLHFTDTSNLHEILCVSAKIRYSTWAVFAFNFRSWDLIFHCTAQMLYCQQQIYKSFRLKYTYLESAVIANTNPPWPLLLIGLFVCQRYFLWEADVVGSPHFCQTSPQVDLSSFLSRCSWKIILETPMVNFNLDFKLKD